MLFTFSVKAQDDWTVPEKDKSINNPLPFNMKTKMAGKDVYMKNCKSCHGDIGKNNFVPLNPEPGDPAGEKFSKNTDGELFYKITNGRGAMPKFKDQLSENERWSVIAYIRSFHKDYKPSASTESQEDDMQMFTGKNISFDVNLNNDNRTAEVKVTGEQDGQTVPASGVRVGFYVKRTFGLLPVGEAQTTDANGIVSAIFPDDLPGDSLGTYQVVVKLIDTDMYGDVSYTKDVQWGKKFIWENPLNKRAMWGTRAKAPIALVLAYVLSVLAVLIVLAWVSLQIKKIAQLGKGN